MKVEKLILKNFRGFHKKIEKRDDEGNLIYSNEQSKEIEYIDAEIEVEFSKSNLTVFIGNNGSGKTTILDALAILFTNLLTKSPGENESPFILESEINLITGGNGYKIKETDIYISSSEIGYSRIDEVNSMINLEISHSSKLYHWRTSVYRDFEKRGMSFINKPYTPNEDAGFDDYGNLVARLKYYNNEKDQNLPLFAYYQTNRVIIDEISKPDKIVSNRKYRAYENSFTKNVYNLDNFFNWFKHWEDTELRESKLIEGKTNIYLDVVRSTLLKFTNNIGMKIRDIRIELDIEEKFSLFLDKEVESENNNLSTIHELKFTQLSSGEQVLLLMVVDIAKKIAIANPGLLEQGIEYALQNATGIVIIDEIDLHLHPKWQRLVMPALMATFPKIQFIVTTHSPLVLKDKKINEVVRLDGFHSRILQLKSEEERNFEYLFEEIFQLKPKIANKGYD